MAFTFAAIGAAVGTNGAGVPSYDTQDGIFITSATTDTSSAAGTFTLGFRPRIVEVIDQTNANKYRWVDGMSAAYAEKTVTAGTYTIITSNGITVAGGDQATPNQASVTLGTGLHVNSSTYRIICYK